MTETNKQNPRAATHVARSEDVHQPCCLVLRWQSRQVQVGAMKSGLLQPQGEGLVQSASTSKHSFAKIMNVYQMRHYISVDSRRHTVNINLGSPPPSPPFLCLSVSLSFPVSLLDKGYIHPEMALFHLHLKSKTKDVDQWLVHQNSNPKTLGSIP